MKIFEELKARGLIAQVTDEEQIRDLEEECIDSRQDVDLAREAAWLLQRVFWND